MINWKRLFLAAGLISLLILLMRGCLYACDGAHTKPPLPEDIELELSNAPMLSLYLHEEKKEVSISLEQYLVGVVAAEMPASFESEALKAQAVAARTYTLRRLEQGGCNSGCDVCSNSSCCQAYDTDAACKKKWGSGYDKNIGKVTRAVAQTQGEALYYGGALIEALYHAASGGRTEDSENVFASAQPYLRSVVSDHEVGSTHIQDEERFSKREFVKKINAAFPKAKLKASKLETTVAIETRYESGRVKSVKLGEDKASGRQMRSALGLRSAWFSIAFTEEEVVIQTKGYGHGVGMSQTGANGMAVDGVEYREILSHYYTGAEIRTQAYSQ